MLVEDAASQRLERHAEDVAPEAEHDHERHDGDDPRYGHLEPCLSLHGNDGKRADRQRRTAADGRRQTARTQYQENEGEQACEHDAGQQPAADAGRVRNQSDRDHAHGGGRQEPSTLVDEVALVLLEGSHLAGIGDRVADVAQNAEQLLGARDLGVVFDECLLVGEAHRHLVDARPAAQRLLDRAGAQRAMQAADARANTGAVGPAGRLFAPEPIVSECCGGVHCYLLVGRSDHDAERSTTR